MLKQEKILVTGASGFIGSRVINFLLNKKLKIIASSRNTDKASKQDWFKKVEYIPFDINCKVSKNLFNYFKKPYKLIHLSWDGLPNYNELYHIEQNLPDNYTFLKNMIANGLNDVTIAGTCFEYGIQNGCLSEECNTNPSTTYAIAKDSLRNFIYALNQKYKFKLRWLRLFYVYGNRQNENSLLGQLRDTIKKRNKTFNMSSGEQLRDYLHVDTMAKYIGLATLQDNVLGNINICSGKPVSIRKLAENYISENKFSIKLNLGFYPMPSYEPIAFWGDNSKLKEIISQYK